MHAAVLKVSLRILGDLHNGIMEGLGVRQRTEKLEGVSEDSTEFTTPFIHKPDCSTHPAPARTPFRAAKNFSERPLNSSQTKQLNLNILYLRSITLNPTEKTFISQLLLLENLLLFKQRPPVLSHEEISRISPAVLWFAMKILKDWKKLKIGTQMNIYSQNCPRPDLFVIIFIY